jgi:hypothetical protein
MNKLQERIQDLLTDYSHSWQLPYVVETREDGNLEVTTEDGSKSWVVSLLISEA